jgi:hypothetical protein
MDIRDSYGFCHVISTTDQMFVFDNYWRKKANVIDEYISYYGFRVKEAYDSVKK